MRIDELELRSFGPFTNLILTFSASKGDFHVLYGRNEAGKSSALRALKSLLFGIPHQSADNFIHDNTKLRIGGRLRNTDGSSIAILRRKGTKNTLLDMNEKPLEESLLHPFLPGVSEDMFETFFGISHSTLAAGSRGILNEGGDVGRSLFSAGMGGTELRVVIQDLNNEADALFRPRGQTQILNRAISEFADIKKALQDLSLPSRIWVEQTGELKKAHNKKKELTQKIEEARHEKNRLTRLLQALPDVTLREKWLSEFLDLGEIVIVDDDFGVKRKEYVERLRTASEDKERSTASIVRLKKDMCLIVIPNGILDHAEIISVLHQRLGSHHKGLSDLSKLMGNMQQLKQDIKIISSEIGTVVKDRPKIALRTKIQDLSGQRQTLIDKLARADKDVSKTETALAKATEQLWLLDAQRSIHALKSAVVRVQKQGDLARALVDTENQLHNMEESIALDLSRLPLWSGTAEELAKIAIPSLETIDRFESRFHEIKAKTNVLDEKEKETLADLDTIRLTIETLRMAGTVHTEEDLLQARAKRALGWSLIIRAWLGKEEIREEAAAFEPDDELPKAYEKAVTRADDVADRLRREADRVAMYAELVARHTAIRESLLNLEAARKNIDSHLSMLDHEWRGQWEPVGIIPLLPKEMRAWVSRQGAIIQKTDKARELRSYCEMTTQHIGEHYKILTVLIGSLGQKTPSDITFDALLALCQSVMESVEETNRKRTALEERIRDLDDDLKAFIQTREALQKDYRAWESDWKTSVSQLGLGPETSPAETNAILAKLEDLFKKTDDMDSFEQRIAGINRDALEFQSDVKNLVENIAPDLLCIPVEQAVAQLNILLGKAKTDSARLADMENLLREQENILHNAEDTIRLLLGHLYSLCEQTGCTHYEDLEEIEKQSSSKRSLQEKLNAVETRLIKIGGGLSIAELMEEAKNVDIDYLPGSIIEIDNQLTELDILRSDLDQRLGGIQTTLEQMDGSGRAAEKAEQSQQVLSSMRENVERYVRLRMCSAILNREIERYRNENQDPLLERAGRIFSDLTLRSFLTLKSDFNDKDEPVLVGIRPSGERVGVQGMSDGTRDQLYLALRVASLEKYLAVNEPVPFVVDDILIRFDDDRSSAALRVLASLSQKTQVIFLTHHARLVELVQTKLVCESPAIYSL